MKSDLSRNIRSANRFLGLLATVVLIKGEVAAQQVRRSLPNQSDISQELAAFTDEPMAQIIPVSQLDTQSTNEQSTTERNSLRNHVEALETHISTLEVQQFSPTALLEGEVHLGFNGVSGRTLNESAVFQQSVQLKLNVSFTGEDSLEVELESGNAIEFSYLGRLTYEGQLDFLSNTNSSRFEIGELSYEFPISDRASLYLSTSGNDLNDFNPFFDRKDDSGVFKFGSENPIHELVEDAGLQLNYDLTDTLAVSLGYFSGEANDPRSGAGLLSGDQSAFVQLEFEPNDRFLLGFTYIHTYKNSDLETGTGSLRSQINLERPVIGNSYGISAFFSPSSKFAIGGWAGFTNATVINLGSANVWNYAFTLAFPDLGKKGNLLYIVIGQEPRLTGTSGFTIDGRRNDPNSSLHVELSYSHRLSEQIFVTPGLVWITAPNHDNRNPDFLVFTVRTTFKF
jgi:hypothetical protein